MYMYTHFNIINKLRLEISKQTISIPSGSHHAQAVVTAVLCNGNGRPRCNDFAEILL